MVSPRSTISGRQEEVSPPKTPHPGAAEAQGPLSTSPSEASGAGGAPAWVLVARLVRPHGRRGELVAEILTDFPEKFHQRTRLFLIPPERLGTRAREIELENFWFVRSRIVLKFRGVDTINDAEALRGFDVAIPAAERAPLEPGSAYMSDLIGCRLIDLNRSSADLGEIVDVDRTSSSTDLLVVRPKTAQKHGGKRAEDLLIPFVRDFLVRIDTGNRCVEMRLPEGLTEINAPITDEEKRENTSRR